MVLDGRDASHTILSGRSLLHQGTSTAPCSRWRYLAVRVAGCEDEVSPRGRRLSAELDERLSSAGVASSQLWRWRPHRRPLGAFPPSQLLAAGCQSEKGLRRKGARRWQLGRDGCSSFLFAGRPAILGLARTGDQAGAWIRQDMDPFGVDKLEACRQHIGMNTGPAL